jgi:NADH-quinone oxidoreductase subunit E
LTSTAIELTPQAAPLASLLDEAAEILARYPEGRQRSALLPLLHLVQSVEGYVTPTGVAFCAEVLGINKAQVGAVATFYTMYKRKPTGDWLVSVCTNTMCNVLGGQEVYDTLTERLGVGHQETTADGTITLEHAECLAACDYGPVMTVNYDFYDGVTPDSALDVVNRLANGERPAPTRGARLCTLKEMSKQLAGFADPRTEAIADGPAGAPTLRGVTLAQEHGIAVAGFDPDTPIPTKERPAEEKPAPAAKVATAARKVAETAKSAAATVAEKASAVADKATSARKAAPRKAADGRPNGAAPAGEGTASSAQQPSIADPAVAGRSTEGGGDVKDPEVRTAEARNPDASTPATDPAATAGGPPATTPAEAAGVAGNEPAGDAKPAGDAAQAQQRNLEQAKEGDK